MSLFIELLSPTNLYRLFRSFQQGCMHEAGGNFVGAAMLMYITVLLFCAVVTGFIAVIVIAFNWLHVLMMLFFACLLVNFIMRDYDGADEDM